MKTSIAFAALACALAAIPAAAQDGDDDAPAPATSLSLGANGGLTTGLWRDVSPRVRAGVEVGGRLEHIEDDDLEDEYSILSLQPAVKVFSRADGALRPYTMAGVFLEQNRRSTSSDAFEAEVKYTTTTVGGRVGVGLEWTPARRVAIGGHAGVEGGVLSMEQTSTTDPAEREMDGWRLGTFTSGVVVHLFF